MLEMTYRDAISRGLTDALDGNPSVFLIGEDIGRYGGPYGETKDFLRKYGESRIRDAPLSEAGFVGMAIGAAIAGLRPIVEIMTINFSLLAMDQIVNNAATLYHMSNGQINVPVIIRMVTGGGLQLAAQHSHSWENFYSYVPGLIVIAPSSVNDARWAVNYALQQADPVLICEYQALLNTRGLVDKVPCTSFDKALEVRRGKDISIVCFGASVAKVISACDILEKKGISVSVLDLRILNPIDYDTVVANIQSTGIVLFVDETYTTGSISGQIMAKIWEDYSITLKVPPKRVCTLDIPIPYAKHLEDLVLPSVNRIVQSVEEIINGIL